MVQFVEMDKQVTLFEQMEQPPGPVVLLNVFTVEPEEAEQLRAAWEADSAFMKRQPGFISAQFHRGTGGSSVFLNYAVWESAGHFGAAFSSPEFQSLLGGYPPSTVASPHLLKKVAVPNVCVE